MAEFQSAVDGSAAHGERTNEVLATLTGEQAAALTVEDWIEIGKHVRSQLGRRAEGERPTPAPPEAPARAAEAARDVAFMTVSPEDWQLRCSRQEEESILLVGLGLPRQELEGRAYRNTNEWLINQFCHEVGAFYGYYDTRSRQFNPPQTANLIAPFQLVAAYDRYQETRFLDMARRCGDWLEYNMVEGHPMSLVLGGVRDNIRPGQLWTKYTADYVILNLALYRRLHEEEFLARAIRSSKFLVQSQNHQFAPKFDHEIENWVHRGWQSFGRVIVAMIALNDVTHDEDWLDRATLWADYGIRLQGADGCFYLIYDTYYSSDIAADEIRALTRIWWRTNRRKYLDAAVAFGDWHVQHQLPNGAWPLSVDRWGVTVGEYIGPGDVPNIAISMLMLHRATGDAKYLTSAVRAMRYSLSQQLVPAEGEPFSDDPNARWGFWSWDPRYDYTMSSDQSTHHVRGYWFLLDYFTSLDRRAQEQLLEDAGEPLEPAGERR
jgi:hypothetical protein